jgi:hypothetical protein
MRFYRVCLPTGVCSTVPGSLLPALIVGFASPVGHARDHLYLHRTLSHRAITMRPGLRSVPGGAVDDDRDPSGVGGGAPQAMRTPTWKATRIPRLLGWTTSVRQRRCTGRLRPTHASAALTRDLPGPLGYVLFDRSWLGLTVGIVPRDRVRAARRALGRRHPPSCTSVSTR